MSRRQSPPHSLGCLLAQLFACYAGPLNLDVIPAINSCLPLGLYFWNPIQEIFVCFLKHFPCVCSNRKSKFLSLILNSPLWFGEGGAEKDKDLGSVSYMWLSFFHLLLLVWKPEFNCHLILLDRQYHWTWNLLFWRGKLTGKWVPRLHLSPPPKHWGYRHRSLHPPSRGSAPHDYVAILYPWSQLSWHIFLTLYQEAGD